MRLTDSLLAPMEIAVNRYLAEDADALASLAAYDGKIMMLQLREVGFSCYLRPHAGGFQIMSESADSVDVTVTTTIPVLMRSLVSDDKGRSLVLGGDIQLDGDTAFAEAIFQVLREADFDPEEWLSRHVGDVAAYRVGQLFRGLFKQGQKTADTVSRDTLKFLKDDSRDLVARAEIVGFMDQVDILRADVERVEARTKRLTELLRPAE